MSRRPIHKLAIRGSVRDLHALELCIERYLGLLAAVAVATWVSAFTLQTGVTWVAYGLTLAARVALFQPWHRELHLSMDSSVLRLQRVALGVVPFARRECPLEGRRLAVERRVVEAPPRDDSGLGCILFLLPLPIAWIVSGLRSPQSPSGHVTE